MVLCREKLNTLEGSLLTVGTVITDPDQREELWRQQGAAQRAAVDMESSALGRRSGPSGRPLERSPRRQRIVRRTGFLRTSSAVSEPMVPSIEWPLRGLLLSGLGPFLLCCAWAATRGMRQRRLLQSPLSFWTSWRLARRRFMTDGGLRSAERGSPRLGLFRALSQTVLSQAVLSQPVLSRSVLNSGVLARGLGLLGLGPLGLGLLAGCISIPGGLQPAASPPARARAIEVPPRTLIIGSGRGSVRRRRDCV